MGGWEGRGRKKRRKEKKKEKRKGIDSSKDVTNHRPSASNVPGNKRKRGRKKKRKEGGKAVVDYKYS